MKKIIGNIVSGLLVLLVTLSPLTALLTPQSVYAASDYYMDFIAEMKNRSTISLQSISFNQLESNDNLSSDIKDVPNMNVSTLNNYLRQQALGNYIDSDIGDNTREYVLSNNGCDSKIAYQEGHWKFTQLKVNVGNSCKNVLKPDKDPILPYRRNGRNEGTIFDDGADSTVDGFIYQEAREGVWFYRVDDKTVRRYDDWGGNFVESDSNQPGIYYSESSSHYVDVASNPVSEKEPNYYVATYYYTGNSAVSDIVNVYDQFGANYDDVLETEYSQRASEIADQLSQLSDATILKCYGPTLSQSERTLIEQQGIGLREAFDSAMGAWTQPGGILEKLARGDSNMPDYARLMFDCIRNEEPDVYANVLRIIAEEPPEPLAVDVDDGEGEIVRDCDGLIPTGWWGPLKLLRLDQWAANAFDWFGCKVIQATLGVAEALHSQAHDALATDENYFTSDSVTAAWASFRTIANILFVIAFLLIILSTVIGGKF